MSPSGPHQSKEFTEKHVSEGSGSPPIKTIRRTKCLRVVATNRKNSRKKCLRVVATNQTNAPKKMYPIEWSLPIKNSRQKTMSRRGPRKTIREKCLRVPTNKNNSPKNMSSRGRHAPIKTINSPKKMSTIDESPPIKKIRRKKCLRGVTTNQKKSLKKMYPRGPRQSKQFAEKNVSELSPPIKQIRRKK